MSRLDHLIPKSYNYGAIKVNSTPESLKIQKYLLSLGYSWIFSGGVRTDYTSYLFIERNTKALKVSSNPDYQFTIKDYDITKQISDLLHRHSKEN
jgi:hypothetical protein